MGNLVIGIDEVGRGCWAGPLVVGAVIMGSPLSGLTDSKKLRSVDRFRLSSLIYEQAIYAKTGWVWSYEVDELGLTKATTLAIKRAIADCANYDKIIIDGSFNFLPGNPRVETMIKADDLIPSVSAASIIAKHARDTYMISQALLHPVYGFETHVGYGTAKHRQAIIDHGVIDLHRLSYKPIQQIMRL